ncbi:hypothetical protein P872_21440 [Rhodonellum psychrophilum GCM71 = DSM 17998]|uniref:DUF3052 domain-containing protein n=2 Tax=Rhodonellum TaxID=336827 RepID=U5BXQ7_9BACT|nr:MULTISPECIES: hypothetical protein [Rhodonellum]ERM80707.1 hypothetical protein P872_21440 [Rhodonellum psychrophilum GCM71 = DSM 17998]SDZ57427.1 hypothetical protein SAMN05444412_1299 [Rhodonellum ikkaensis]
MDPLLKKLNYKENTKIFIGNAPKDLDEKMKDWIDQGLVTNLPQEAGFFLFFAQTEEEIRVNYEAVHANIQNDEIFWMAYPKGTSKKYKAVINRDKGWAFLGKSGFEGVRQVAIDEDWSALRLRKLEFIKKLTRKNRMTLA